MLTAASCFDTGAHAPVPHWWTGKIAMPICLRVLPHANRAPVPRPCTTVPCQPCRSVPAAALGASQQCCLCSGWLTRYAACRRRRRRCCQLPVPGQLGGRGTHRCVPAAAARTPAGPGMPRQNPAWNQDHSRRAAGSCMQVAQMADHGRAVEVAVCRLMWHLLSLAAAQRLAAGGCHPPVAGAAGGAAAGGLYLRRCLPVGWVCLPAGLSVTTGPWIPHSGRQGGQPACLVCLGQLATGSAAFNLGHILHLRPAAATALAQRELDLVVQPTTLAQLVSPAIGRASLSTRCVS